MRTRPLRDLVEVHPAFVGLDEEALELLAGCATNVRLGRGGFVFHEGETADRCWVLRSGRVALEMHSGDGGTTVLSTLGAGQLLGWSWLIPPHRWNVDARVLEDGSALTFDAGCLREKCEADPRFGYELMKRFVALSVDRLQATRLQLIDLYGPTGEDRS